MKLNFCFNIGDFNELYFWSQEQEKWSGGEKVNFEPLASLFDNQGAGNLAFYHSLLKEIAQIASGQKAGLDENIALRPYSPTGELSVTRNNVVLEIAEEKKRIELAIPEFTALVQAWIKFVEINTAAFKTKKP